MTTAWKLGILVYGKEKNDTETQTDDRVVPLLFFLLLFCFKERTDWFALLLVRSCFLFFELRHIMRLIDNCLLYSQSTERTSMKHDTHVGDLYLSSFPRRLGRRITSSWVQSGVCRILVRLCVPPATKPTLFHNRWICDL